MDLCSVAWIIWDDWKNNGRGRHLVVRWYSCHLERELAMMRRHLCPR